MSKSSRISGFHKMSPAEQRKAVEEFCGFQAGYLEKMDQDLSLDIQTASRMVENVIGLFEMPYGIATNFKINNKDYLVPMVTEESSVIAACGNAARLAREGGGFFSIVTEPVMIAQIQVVHIKNPHYALVRIYENKERLLALANEQDPMLCSLGGGAFDIEVRIVDAQPQKFLVIHLFVNVKDAMGANAVNTMAEAIALLIEEITGGEVLLRILSNLADRRLARSMVRVPKEALGGEEVVDKILLAYAFAASDPYRAATHNKGIMNGISAVVLATGNDTRAIEAGAHAYACRNGRYTSLTTWEKNIDGDLCGTIELPLALGLVGGATALHPKAKLSLSILNVSSARQLAEITAAVGLAQNLAAVRVLATEGVQKGHMRLHAKNIAVMAGASGPAIDVVAQKLIESGKIRVDKAKEILAEML